MTVRTGICVLVLAASAAWAQAPISAIKDTRKLLNADGKPTEQKRESASQKTAVAGNASAKSHEQNGKANSKAPAQKRTMAQPNRKVEKKTVATSKRAARPASDSNEQGAEGGSEASGGSAAVHNLRGHRDPFVTVIRSQAVGNSGCSTGKKCIDVDKMDLKGIVRSQAGMIALVENQQRKTYFLHENDPVARGHVVKINPDSVVFQQTVVDRLGKQSTKDVVKRLITPAA